MSLESRFWSKVRKLGPGDCWPWLAATNEHGYGVMRPEGTGPTVKAHRVSALLDGRDPAGRVVLHSCDNPPCVNPAHLVVGDQADIIEYHAVPDAAAVRPGEVSCPDCWLIHPEGACDR